MGSKERDSSSERLTEIDDFVVLIENPVLRAGSVRDRNSPGRWLADVEIPGESKRTTRIREKGLEA